MRQRRIVAVACAALLVAGFAGACSKNTGEHTKGPAIRQDAGSISTDPADSQGPAKPMPGAVRGGTLYSIQQTDYETLDPQQIYVNASIAVGQLFTRTLTMFRKDPETGKDLLVGDLATDTGTDVDHDGKTWRYTLKKGLKYEDGTAITASDVAYGVARSFSPQVAEGPHYIQQWLTGRTDYNKTYQGPYDGGAKMPPGVTVSGRTITFHLRQAEPDFPFAASMGTTTPLPPARDKGPHALADHPFSSGPYKIESYQREHQLVLVRNKYWDPRTDPVRHDYVDRFVVEMGPSPVEITNRLLADNGNDRYAVQVGAVAPELISKVLGDKSLAKRELAGYLDYVRYLDINTRRITDVDERRAINYAMDKAGFLQAEGGSPVGDVASTIQSPTTIGYRKYDAYPTPGNHGDVAKAKKLLKGAKPKLVLAFPNTAIGQKEATKVQQSLTRAGFRIVLKPADQDNYLTILGRRDNPYDIYVSAWASDWPSGSTIIPPLFDGTAIAASGNNSRTYLDAKPINDRIAAISKEPAAQGAADWMKLDRQIMTDYAPLVPLYYEKNLSLYGSRVHGILQGGAPRYYDAWVTQ
ncbi:ABC transporter substrate-binding protein [Actinocatenispora comari]|jgi:peptide/nickel transport system substrate-binding protein|uniref:ABC transporter n=1 Tax=Actinocatenispora comari TaxID=2807577 RepID=A0A8J4AI60_9ACTN|nr:ABC transporter substrate-binding protein [Actinocatenispora comari]GIL31159.1 ABC transporter [Actinocatenispora comari]